MLTELTIRAEIIKSEIDDQVQEPSAVDD